MKTTIRHAVVVLAVSAAVGLGVATAARHGEPPRHPPQGATPDGPEGAGPSGHLENPIALRRDERVTVDIDRSNSQLRFYLQNRFPRKAVMRYAVELTDELGNALVEPFHSTPVEMEAGAEAPFDLDVPSRIARSVGFYLYRVTAVGRSGDDFADASLEIGLAVMDGTAQMLTDEEWLEFSLANMGGE